MGYVEKCCTAGEDTGDNIIWLMRFACWITKAIDIHKNTHTQNT